MHYLTPALVAALGWSIVPIIDRYNLGFINPFTLLTIRGCVYFIVALTIGFVAYYNNKFNIKEGYKKGGNLFLFLLILSPIIGYGLGHVGYYYSLGMAKSSIITITLLSFCLPVVIIAVLATCVYKDEINLKMVIGIILTLVGVTITVLANPNHPPPEFLRYLFPKTSARFGTSTTIGSTGVLS